ncbi:MAG: MBL fold metallo-hydrolase [Planctomycetia bacterium]|nr:MBL fold metallo-hydrolase [Planctomycetia bacterium]
MIFCPLVSGSSGNSTYICYKKTKILVDCGRSGKHIENCLRQIGVDIHDINAILITHSHTDHTQSAIILSKRYDIPIYASVGTWREMSRKFDATNMKSQNIRLFQSSSTLLPIDLGDFEAQFFAIPHDTAEPVGYRFTNGKMNVAIATDIGHITPTLRKNLFGAKLVLLESNHDVQKLLDGPYTQRLKKRILGDYGHLSNDNAGLFSVELIQNGTERIYLGHLSQENNSPEIAWRTVSNVLKNHQLDGKKDAEIFLTRRDEPSRISQY